VVDMTNSAAVSVPGHEFDDFLFAPIGEDRNDMLVSVLSALARLDIDPWQEAAQLAQLSRDAATRRLTSLIAALPDQPATHLDIGTIAARLIALLPRPPDRDIPSGATSPGVSAATASRAAVIYVVLLACMLVFQSNIATRQLPGAQGDSAPAAAFSPVFPEMPPPGSGP